jgi:hypothetical protein
MKRLYLLLFSLFVGLITATSQDNLADLKDALSQMENGKYKGTFVNDSLVIEYLNEYLSEAKERGLNLKSHIDDINWILIEPGSNIPLRLTGTNLGLVDKEHKLILLSKSCLLDRYILKSVLYRELSHYLGIPYNEKGLEIMSLKKPKGYSYAWFDDYEIRKFVYDDLFTALKRVIN